MDSRGTTKVLLTEYVDFLSYPPIKWVFILSCLGLALVCYFLTRRKDGKFYLRSVFSYRFPKSIYLHRSTKEDLLYTLSLPIIAGLIFMPALALSTSGVSFGGTKYALMSILGEHQFQLPNSRVTQGLLVAGFTVCMAMGADFGFFLHHWLFHKVPFLWEFHKVHHSAKVLTPLTDFRAHPVEILTYSFATGIGSHPSRVFSLT